MPTCFVIQPFDDGKFEHRFHDTFKPAIKKCDLDAYKVDEDDGAEVLIEAIEEGIRSSAICLADITTDNANVWYEVGYAFAVGRPVVMICSDERQTKYPFDIQGRKVIPYKTGSVRDYHELGDKIEKVIKVRLANIEQVASISENNILADVEGLDAAEMSLLAVVAGWLNNPEDYVSSSAARREFERAGFNSLAFGLSVRRLAGIGFLETFFIDDDSYNREAAFRLKSEAWDWLAANKHLFSLRKEKQSQTLTADSDDIPF